MSLFIVSSPILRKWKCNFMFPRLSVFSCHIRRIVDLKGEKTMCSDKGCSLTDIHTNTYQERKKESLFKPL